MSVEVMRAVWKFSTFRGEKLLVLLALADWANDDGYCWPTMSKLAQKARITERGASGIMSSLRKDGIVDVIQEGGGRGKFSIFRIKGEATSGFEFLKTPNVEPETLNVAANKPRRKLYPNKEEPSLYTSVEPSFSLAPPEHPKKALSEEVRQYINSTYLKRFGCNVTWDGAEGNQLSRAIKANPSWNLDVFQKLIDSRYASEGVNGERPCRWLGDLAKYLGGPLDKYGNPKQQSSPVVQREVTISERMRALAAGSSR